MKIYYHFTYHVFKGKRDTRKGGSFTQIQDSLVQDRDGTKTQQSEAINELTSRFVYE